MRFLDAFLVTLVHLPIFDRVRLFLSMIFLQTSLNLLITSLSGVDQCLFSASKTSCSISQVLL